VLRHRIIRLPKGVPDTPPPSPGPTTPRAAEPVDEQPTGTAKPPAAPAGVETEAAEPAPAAAESSESAETPEASETPESPSAAPQE